MERRGDTVKPGQEGHSRELKKTGGLYIEVNLYRK